mmetsp:Transcript_131949/g.422546  ORF Transcript_131949/g.422546 Transcript_131949/m.422546 type:complete len:384 (-) Transcript_131949:16-1167(-)
MAEATQRLNAAPDKCHGRCYGAEAARDAWPAPQLAVRSDVSARPGYDSMGASEYEDEPEVLAAKVSLLAELIGRSRRCIVYSGAGLSTSAGIQDYATQAPESLSGAGGAASSFRSPMCAQPTAAHRALVALERAGKMHRWINQNHDGLPQKAGLPQEAINEIHGAWHAPDNPVIPMSGCLRDDLFDDVQQCEREADLVLALGTSLCGMNADRVVSGPARRAAAGGPGAVGSVIIGLQQTVLDGDSTLRIFGRCDDVFLMLAEKMGLQVAPEWPEGTYFVPDVLVGRSQDLRDGAALVITRGMHAGAVGEVDGTDREGNVKCRFKCKPKSGKLRAFVPMVVGRWWFQAAVDGQVLGLPVVNVPPEGSEAPGANRLRELMRAYAQ